MSDIIFKVGQEYENRKGVYEVLGAEDDVLHIRWENGEEVATTKGLQSRIIESMYRELACIKAKKTAKGKQAGALNDLIRFEGMKEVDFSGDVARATWRHYNTLGGAVAVRLKTDKFNIVPWPSFGVCGVYWTDLDHRCYDAHQSNARFFARLDDKCFYFGLDIESSSPEGDETDGKNAFISWLADSENDSWLNTVVATHDLSICNTEAEDHTDQTIKASEGKWILFNGGGQEKETQSLTECLDELTNGPRLELHIAKTIDKKDAVTRGAEIADDIAGLFEVLIPAYEASSTMM